MPKRYWWVLATYIIMQLSSLIAGPVLVAAGVPIAQAGVIWGTISFVVALIVMLILLRKDMTKEYMARDRLDIGRSIGWAFLGIFLVFAVQYVSGMIELYVLGVHHGSENTQRITEAARKIPIFIIVIAVIGPIMEEIVFRKIIFGTLLKKFDFTIAALVSSLIFGLAHLDPTFLLTYAALGFALAFLYYKTKRILVSIIAHASMNTFVVIMQVIIGPDKLQQWQERLKETQQLICHFFS